MKLVVPEQGSSDVAATWESASRRISTILLYAEACAAIGRARRMGRVDTRDLPRARRLVDAFWAELDRVPLNEGLARRAGEVAHRHGLRAYDAVHLATAASVADQETLFVAADGDLLAAARAIGITTLQL